LVQLALGAAVAVLLSVALAAADVYPGRYDARGRGVKAMLDVGNNGGATLDYAMKTACGRSGGRIELEKSGAGLEGRRVTRGPGSSLRTSVAKVALSPGGEQVVGKIRESLSGGKLAGCHAKRGFTAGVGQVDGFVPPRDAGHYSGAAGNGMPISFDVVADGTRVESIAVDVRAECYDESDPLGDDFAMTVHVSGMSARVADDGGFYIDYAPDENTEYEFDGTVADEEAVVEVAISGYFDASGNPSSTGRYACDSWGDRYRAARS
jgi:hypothetical protein